MLGAEQEVVVIELAEGLSVSLPLERARAQLRPLANEADLHRVEQTLRENGPLSEDEKESYYQDSTYVAEVLGCPRDAQPADWADFRRYWHHTIAEHR